jgi:hypothetical protein
MYLVWLEFLKYPSPWKVGWKNLRASQKNNSRLTTSSIFQGRNAELDIQLRQDKITVEEAKIRKETAWLWYVLVYYLSTFEELICIPKGFWRNFSDTREGFWYLHIDLILKCLKLTIDIIFQSHFIAHLMRSKARDHANPDSGPATHRRPFQARQRFSRQIKWVICIGFSVDFTLNVLLAFRNCRR